MTTAPTTGVVGVVVAGGVVTGVVGVVGVVVAGGVVTGVVAVVLDGLRLRAAAATLLSLTVVSLAEAGVALATVAAVLLDPAAVSELSLPPHALNTALDAKQINNVLLSFIIIYVLRKD
jgi:hypothetical protein